MHPSVMAFVGSVVEDFGLGRRPVLEVGSRDVNGSPRRHFAGPYIGVDIESGPGVDRILNAHRLHELLPDQWPVVVCCEMLEHDLAPWESLHQMSLVASDGAHLILTARGFDERGCWPVHGYPNDCYRFHVEAVGPLLDWTGWTPLVVQRDPDGPGFLALAQKGRR